MTRRPHTFDAGGNTATWAATLVEYDTLGRVKRQSVPTEVDATWNPAGDDYARGFLWTYQKYDWKGRVVRRINTDGVDSETLNDSDILISYEGCGCAGGQITTVQGENIVETDWQGNNPVTLGRRTQKIYQDILGRERKTEVYGWNGSNVYSTSVNLYNGRDQITTTYQYAGAEGSPDWRAVSMGYDGQGRMQWRKYPIENLGTNTRWTYNADDSINTVTDPRGVVTNFSYYPQTGLLRQITYDVPYAQAATIPDTPDVTFGYDNLGNRVSMTDGTGTAAYAYDELSRMTSETKTFTGLSDSFSINYTYELAGELKTIGDPQDSARKVSYNHDRTGRVVGAEMVINGVATTYIHDTKYRAWGAMKGYKYDFPYPSSTAETFFNFFYDNRLQVSGYDVGRDSAPVSTTLQRYADGKLRMAAVGSVLVGERSYAY